MTSRNKTRMTLLVVDDDPQIRRLLARNLTAEGFDVVLASHGEEALYQASLRDPQLVILDLAMPVMGGIEAIKRLREWYGRPILILSATDEERQKIRALDLGADDYLTKPFSPGELVARVRAALRREERLNREAPVDQPVISFGDIRVDLNARVVYAGEREVHLTRTEYDLLQTLASNMGKILTHPQLLRAVWGPEYGEETEYLRTFVKQLRRKLEADPARPKHILTEPGVGYRLVKP